VVTSALAVTLNTPMSQLRRATLDRIVIIEGGGTLKSLPELFCLEGYEVDLVPDVMAGLEMLRQRRPSPVIVDLEHPGLSGCDLCEKIANLIPGLPVVILSASSEVAEKVRLLETGADDYVTIPFSSQELVARLRALIRRASRTGLANFYLDEAGCS
jgi:DNA-binding response OmpR family regulator